VPRHHPAAPGHLAAAAGGAPELRGARGVELDERRAAPGAVPWMGDGWPQGWWKTWGKHGENMTHFKQPG